MDSIQDQLYAPIYDVVPKDWGFARQYLVEEFTSHADAINAREIGWYLDIETDTGKKFIPVTNAASSEVYRTVFRKVIDVGTLPNAGTTTTAHGISFGTNFCLLNLYGGATDPSTNAVPLPYASTTAANSIQVSMDTTNINITTSIDYSGYTCSYIVIEYLQEV